jgi:hypothetical protein
MFRRRIGVVVVVVVEDGLGERAKKNLFSHKKKNCFSMTTRVRSRLAYLEDAPFPICFLFAEIAQGVGQREYADLKE